MNTTLKVGEPLTYGGYGCRVSHVEPGFIRIINREGYASVIENPVPDNFISEPQGSCPELPDLLTQFAAWKEEFTKPISEEEKAKAMKTDAEKKPARGGLAAEKRELEAAMTPEQKKAAKAAKDAARYAAKKAAKDAQAESSGNPHGGLTTAAQIASGGKLAKAPKTPKVPKEKVERAKTFDGITDYIAGLVAEGKNNEEVVAACRLKYPGCGKAWCGAVAGKKRVKAEKAKVAA